MCIQKCSCHRGFLYNDLLGTCVLPDECPTVHECNKNEYFLETKHIEQTCDGIPIYKKGGCVCEEGFVRLENEIGGICLRKEECPICQPNEIWNSCGSGCEITCQNKENPPICSFLCIPKCSCKSGFIWDEVSNECVPNEFCLTSLCPPNEYWNDCGSNCEPSCSQELKG